MARADATFRGLRPGDLEALAPQLRAEDAAEVLASSGVDPLEGLRLSVGASHQVLALELGGELAALFGVALGPRHALIGRHPDDYDVVWALTGAAVRRHARAFWRASQRAIAVLLAEHPVLVNAIDARYEAALRWAARLGAEVRPAVRWGVSGLPFHPVIWRSNV